MGYLVNHYKMALAAKKNPYTLRLIMYAAAIVLTAPNAISNPGVFGVVAGVVVSTVVVVSAVVATVVGVTGAATTIST